MPPGYKLVLGNIPLGLDNHPLSQQVREMLHFVLEFRRLSRLAAHAGCSKTFQITLEIPRCNASFDLRWMYITVRLGNFK
jgi:hypothetical protein